MARANGPLIRIRTQKTGYMERLGINTIQAGSQRVVDYLQKSSFCLGPGNGTHSFWALVFDLDGSSKVQQATAGQFNL